ncbi:hypothetical protein JVU11DRAFT_7346 [Chiua virens]|nr:hypothetical protein JVU11DRAFT_7346 [Chiua virens]
MSSSSHFTPACKTTPCRFYSQGYCRLGENAFQLTFNFTDITTSKGSTPSDQLPVTHDSSSSSPASSTSSQEASNAHPKPKCENKPEFELQMQELTSLCQMSPVTEGAATLSAITKPVPKGNQHAEWKETNAEAAAHEHLDTTVREEAAKTIAQDRYLQEVTKQQSQPLTGQQHQQQEAEEQERREGADKDKRRRREQRLEERRRERRRRQLGNSKFHWRR